MIQNGSSSERHLGFILERKRKRSLSAIHAEVGVLSATAGCQRETYGWRQVYFKTRQFGPDGLERLERFVYGGGISPVGVITYR